MPPRPKSICRQAGCGAKIDTPGYCDKHLKAKRKDEDDRRGTAQERGYTSAWTKARAAWLRKYPLCTYCLAAVGISQSADTAALIAACLRARIKLPTASVVDHIIAHRLKEAIDSGDEARIAKAKALFWDSENNWQSLCKLCHDSVKQAEERASR